MPYSATTFDNEVKALISKLPIKTALDIGAGNGKHGRVIRAAHPAAKITGVEIERKYVEQFKLRDVYNDVIVTDAVNLIANPDVAYDLVVFGDVLEHMRWSDGMSLLQFFCYRAKWILAQYPHRYLQNTKFDSVTEAHISVWHVGDFARFDHAAKTKSGESGKKDGIVINGFLRGKNDVSVCELWKII